MTTDLVQRDVNFNIFSGMLKALENGDGVKRLRTTASSTIKDLSGDEMTLNALQKMAQTAENRMTIFLNHKYMVPEDVLGTVEKAQITSRGEFYDLDFDVRINNSNPRAIATHDSIVNDGVQLGCSIGALIPAGGAKQTDSGLEIDDVKLLEASIVGIPANPRSFVQYAVKALNQAALEDAEEDEVVTSGPPLQIKATPDSTVTIVTDVSGEVEVEQKAKVWVTVDTEDSADTDAPAASAGSDKSKGSKAKQDGKKKGDEPDVTKDAAPSDEEDEGESDPASDPLATEVPATQEAPPESDPESDGAADEAEVDEQIEATRSLGIEALTTVLKSTTSELVEARKALIAENTKVASLEKQLSDSEENLELAKQIVERLAALPLGRKTSFSKGVSEFRSKLAGIYSDDVMNLMESKPDGN